VTAVWAHRGAAQLEVANTVAAFAEARRLGADGVELDVHLSADGALVVHHDPAIDGVGEIAATGVSQLPDWVPLLADVLDACEGMVVNVELKADHPVGLAAAAAAALDELGWTERVVVSSFDPTLLDDVAATDPRLARGQLVAWTADATAALDAAAVAGHAAIHPFVPQVDAALVARAHDRGLAVNVWTVNAPKDLRAMVALGVDAVITDVVPEALAVVQTV
jgi:glycerophosphoryl diester phosphodiesterase